jgi:endonuclease YncB( thermonuclease family)
MLTRAVLKAVLAAMAVAVLPGTAWADATSTANVIDGETLEMQGQIVKLFGIDALEPDQICLNGNRPWHCGEESARSLSSLIGGQPVRCQTIRNMGGHILAVCDLNGDDLAAWMVANGWAFADRATTPDYVPFEETAKSAHEGVHSGEFVTPWDWREGKRLKLPETPQTEEQEDDLEDKNLPDYGPLNMAP